MMTKAKTTPPAERLHELFTYQPETGLLINKVSRGSRAREGEPAGYVNKGYRVVAVDGTLYPAHRIVWKITYDEDPSLDIHHGKGGPLDNRLENLSLLTHRANCSIEKTEKSSLPVGVYLQKGLYRAQITLQGKNTRLGYYKTPEQASGAYRKALDMHLHGFSPEEVQRKLKKSK